MGRQRRRAQPAGRRHPGRGARIRRPHHHGSVLVQGDRRRGADLLRRRPRTLRPGGRAWRSGTRGCATSPHRTSRWRWCSRRIRPNTPASATPSAWTPRPARSPCCAPCASAGYDIGDIPGVDANDGDALVHALIERGRTGSRLAHRGAIGGQPDPGVRPRTTARGSPRCPPNSPTLSSSTGARRPASCSSTAVAIRTVKSSSPQCRSGNVVLLVQPPRGFGENPVAIYHDPDLPPSHHYLAAYRWLDGHFPAALAPTPSSTSASTATWSGCPARRWACRRPAAPTPRSATCR